jgi:hypothetical protein
MVCLGMVETFAHCGNRTDHRQTYFEEPDSKQLNEIIPMTIRIDRGAYKNYRLNTTYFLHARALTL